MERMVLVNIEEIADISWKECVWVIPRSPRISHEKNGRGAY